FSRDWSSDVCSSDYAVRKLLAGLLLNLGGILWTHQPGSAFFNQCFKIDTVNDVQWIKYVSFGLRHFLTLAVSYQAMDIHSFKWNLCLALFVFHQGHGQHDHPCNPEEDDVEAGNQNISRMELLKEIRLLRPAQGRECPEAGAEPGVEYVFILLQ